ncbi:MAG: DinB family protein [Anaerolineae bacterium]|nr:DinB family protein [Anaerolineae bacterium]
MDAQVFQTLFEYNQWANRRVWACVEQLSEAQFNQPNDYSIGSIHIQVAHTMGVEYWWFQFIRTGELRFVREEDCETRPAIRAKWDETEQLIRDTLAELTPAGLMREIKPEFWEPEKPPLKVYEALFQVAIHSTDHRAQTLAALHRVGGPTTPQDVLFFAFDRARVPWKNE